MNTRLRLLVVFLGAVVVGATFSFNVWFPLVVNQDDVVLFPELPESLYEAFDALPEDRKTAYLEQRDANPAQAARMAVAALQPPRIVPNDQQENPQRSGQVASFTAEFTPITVNRSVTGKFTLYELPDGSRYLWFEEFSAVPGDDLRLFLSAVNETTLLELTEDDDDDNDEYRLTLDDFLLGPLRFEVGNHAYEIPVEADLSLYNSVIIYSDGFDLLWGYAEF